MPTEDVIYEPVSVKVTLAEMKDTAELLIDLAYSAVLLDSAEVAEEVLSLEDHMDVLQLQARMSLLMSARSPDDAETLAPVLGVVGAAEKISDAAGDIAKVVLEEVGIPEPVRAALPEAVERLARVRIAADSPYATQTLAEIDLETQTGVRVIAIRRDGDWLLDPSRDTELRDADVALIRGPADALGGVYERASGETYERRHPPEPEHDDVARALDSVVLMKNTSELAVDLAYGAVLFDSTDVAEEVFELEAEIDALNSRFEVWLLRAASRVDDPVSLRGLLHIARSMEVISDAALEISEGVLRGLGTHPVVAAAVEESDEIIVRVAVESGSELAGETLGDRHLQTDIGMRVLAIRRAAAVSEAQGSTAEAPPDPEASDRGWIVSPGPATTIRAGDVLLAKGTRSGAASLETLSTADG